jgi:biopolymer transport protein ExbB/TolQ
MAMETVVDASVNLINQITNIAHWMQALGVVVLLWIIFQIISLAINQKRMKKINIIKKDMERIEAKIDRILRKR